MFAKGAASKPQVWRPASIGETKLFVGGEISSLALTCSAGSGVINIYDANSASGATEDNLRVVLEASAAVNDIREYPGPLAFSNGILAKADTGTPGNCVLNISTY